MQLERLRRSRLLLLLPALLAFLHLQKSVDLSPSIDFYLFWLGAAVTDGSDARSLYDPDAQRRIGLAFLEKSRNESPRAFRAALVNQSLYANVMEHNATPLFYVFFRLFHSGHFDRDVFRFQTASNLLFVASLVAICFLLDLGPLAGFAIIGFFSAFYPPTHLDLMASNVSRLQCFFVVAYLAVHRLASNRAGHLLAGAVLAFAVMFKPVVAFAPFLLATRWIMDREWKQVIWQGSGFAVASTALAAIGAVVFGSLLAWGDWFAALSRVLGAPYPIEHGNLGISRIIAASFGVDVSKPLAGLLCGATAGLLFWTRPSGREEGGGRERNYDLDFLLCSLGSTFVLIVGNISWYTYYVLLIPIGCHLLKASCLAGRAAGPLPILWRGLVVSALAAVVFVGRDAAAGGGFRIEVAWLLLYPNLLAVALAFSALFLSRTPSVDRSDAPPRGQGG